MVRKSFSITVLIFLSKATELGWVQVRPPRCQNISEVNKIRPLHSIKKIRNIETNLFLALFMLNFIAKLRKIALTNNQLGLPWVMSVLASSVVPTGLLTGALRTLSCGLNTGHISGCSKDLSTLDLVLECTLLFSYTWKESSLEAPSFLQAKLKGHRPIC